MKLNELVAQAESQLREELQSQARRYEGEKGEEIGDLKRKYENQLKVEKVRHM